MSFNISQKTREQLNPNYFAYEILSFAFIKMCSH